MDIKAIVFIIQFQHW